MNSDTKVNVLLVDDKPENLLAIESILDDLGQNLVRATSAKEALRFLLVEEAALILLDVQMPGVNGFELAELIRQRERTQHTPIIFVSAESLDEKFIFQGYSLGAVDYLTKPLTPEILKSKVSFFIKLFRQTQEIRRQAALLEQKNIELDNLNADLERRVRERTSELEVANTELENEIGVRKRSEARLATEHAITRVLADAKSFEEASPLILKAIIDHLEAEYCGLWVLDETGSELFCIDIQTAKSTKDLDLFLAESRRARLHRGVGLPGHVWQKLEPVWIADTITTNSAFPRAPFAASAGLKSAVGFPIIVGQKFLGVIELYVKHHLEPDSHLLEMFEAAGSEIGQFIKRKLAEAERERLLIREKNLREQAETANRLKDQFLATVSHELRTPLNAILGWGQMLNAGKLDAEEQTGALQTIYRNARAQAKLIDDLLDTSRLITGNLHLNLSPTDVVPIVDSAIDVVRPAAKSKDIKIIAEHGDLETITCDAQRLQQMVWNLLTNAVKFTPPGGSVNVNVTQDSSKLQIAVSDTGSGIDPEFLPFVFDRFRQEDSSSTRPHDGLGLGLAIVKHLAELHGGTVSARSEGAGKGSTFTVSLPRTLPARPLTPKVAEDSNGDRPLEQTPAKLDGIRILVVDDDIDTCEMLKFALNLNGADVMSSSSVDDAFNSMGSWKPDVLLTDINMPEKDGYSLIERLRSSAPDSLSTIPVIALTAMARNEDSERALSAGFQLHLPKPVDIDALGDAIAKLVSKGS